MKWKFIVSNLIAVFSVLIFAGTALAQGPICTEPGDGYTYIKFVDDTSPTPEFYVYNCDDADVSGVNDGTGCSLGKYDFGSFYALYIDATVGRNYNYSRYDTSLVIPDNATLVVDHATNDFLTTGLVLDFSDGSSFTPFSGGAVLYNQWTHAEYSLSSHAGKTLTSLTAYVARAGDLLARHYFRNITIKAPDTSFTCSDLQQLVACTTITDANFNTGQWLLDGYLTSISDGLLQLYGDNSVTSDSIAWQPVQLQSSVYTVTVRAGTDVADQDGYLYVCISDNPPPNHADYPSDCRTKTLTTTLETYQLSLINYARSSGYLTVGYHTDSATGVVANVDYICIDGQNDIPLCQAGQNEWMLDVGSNHGVTLIDDVYGESGGWFGVDYFDGTDTNAPEFTIVQARTGLYTSDFLGGFSFGDTISIAYDYDIIPQVITVTGFFPYDAVTGDTQPPKLEVWTDDGYGWRRLNVFTDTYFSVDETFYSLLDSQSGAFGTAVIDLNTNYFPFYNPVKLGLSMVIQDDGAGYWAGFDNVQVYGCVTGTPSNVGSCILADPDLNEKNGQPNDYYWLGTYQPQADGAGLTDGDILYQNILIPNPGLYNLEIRADAYGVAGCALTVEAVEVGGTQVYFSQDVPCKDGINQLYNVAMDLPAEAVELSVTARQGDILIDRMCLTNALSGLTC
ncbi:MAG: hypothetical protein D6706_11905, partial [Chloroflexi bacterium]